MERDEKRDEPIEREREAEVIPDYGNGTEKTEDEIRNMERNGDVIVWNYDDVHSFDHHNAQGTVFSKSYYHRNVMTDEHAHSFYEINIVFEGEGDQIIDGVKYRAAPGAVYIIPPRVRHRLLSKKNLSVYHILLNNYFFTKYKSQFDSLNGFFSLFLRDVSTFNEETVLRLDERQLATIRRLCILLSAEQQSVDVYPDHVTLICNNLIVTIIAELAKMVCANHFQPKRRSDDDSLAFVRILDHINTHYADKLTIDSLLEISYFSKSTLIKAFRTHTGSTPFQYIYSVRTQKAKEKIDNGVTNVTFLAQECGFFDASHLDRHFTRQFGIGPKRYILSRAGGGSDESTPPPMPDKTFE